MSRTFEYLPAPPSTDPDIEDDFDGGPRPDLWVDHYLPHWTTPDRSAASYESTSEGLRLRIDADQLDWRPEDAPMRVSNLQTATFSGPVSSQRGTHRHREDGLIVRTATPTRLLWTPSAGRVDVTVSATRDPGCMLAAWLIGTEHEDRAASGEICLFEIDAAGIGADAIGVTTTARVGLMAHSDPRLTSDMAEICLPFDATRPHTWTAIWGNGETLIGYDGLLLRHILQAPDYPLQLMVDLFEIGEPVGSYPKSASVHHFRGWESE